MLYNKDNQFFDLKLRDTYCKFDRLAVTSGRMKIAAEEKLLSGVLLAEKTIGCAGGSVGGEPQAMGPRKGEGHSLPCVKGGGFLP